MASILHQIMIAFVIYTFLWYFGYFYFDHVSFSPLIYGENTENTDPINWCTILRKPNGQAQRKMQVIDSCDDNKYCYCRTKKEWHDYYLVDSVLYWNDEVRFRCCQKSKDPNCDRYLIKTPAVCTRDIPFI